MTVLICFNAHNQNLKTHSGNMQDAILDQGKAIYTYYEKDGDIIRHGKFSYTWSDKETPTLRGKSYTYSLSKKIDGEFKDGLKHGKWTYVINFTDYPLGHSMLGVNGDIFSTGNITMTANYLNGEVNGTWTYQENYKDRYMSPTYTTWNWSAYGAPISHSITANFKNGNVVGKLTRKDSFTKINIDLNFDEKSYIDGIGKIDEKGKIITYTTKNGLLIKEVHSDMSSGSSKVQVDNTEILKDEKTEFSKVEFSLLENRYGHIAQTLSYFKQNRYFNYNMPTGSKPLIGGDKVMSEGFGGAIMINIEECRPFLESKCAGWGKTQLGQWSKGFPNTYQKAHDLLFDKNYSNALNEFEKCKECLYASWAGVCSDDKAYYLNEVDSILKVLNVTIEEQKRWIEDEKIAKEEIASWNKRTELLNANIPEFLYLVRNADRQNITLRNLLFIISNIKPENEISNIINQKSKPEEQNEALKYLFENISGFPKETEDVNKSLQKLLMTFDVHDIKFLYSYAKTNSKFEKLFKDKDMIRRITSTDLKKEVYEIKNRWDLELQQLTNDYITSKILYVINDFENRLDQKLNPNKITGQLFNQTPSPKTFSARKTYKNIFQVFDNKTTLILTSDATTKLSFLYDIEVVVSKIQDLNLKEIDKEISKMKKSTNEEKYEALKKK